MSERNHLGPSALDRLHTTFQKLDADKSGSISIYELKTACSQLSMSVSDEELKEFCRSDVSGDGELDFTEFCDYYVHRLKVAFREIDMDGSGTICSAELKSAFDRLGFQVGR